MIKKSIRPQIGQLIDPFISESVGLVPVKRSDGFVLRQKQQNEAEMRNCLETNDGMDDAYQNTTSRCFAQRQDAPEAYGSVGVKTDIILQTQLFFPLCCVFGGETSGVQLPSSRILHST